MGDTIEILERNRHSALSYIESIGTQDFESIISLIREDATFWQVGKKLELAGAHDITETALLAEKAISKFPNGIKFNLITLTAEGNRVAIEAESEAVMANNKPYNNQYVFFFYFDDNGKITEFREYWDTLYAFETMFEGKTKL